MNAASAMTVAASTAVLTAGSAWGVEMDLFNTGPEQPVVINGVLTTVASACGSFDQAHAQVRSAQAFTLPSGEGVA